MSTDAPRYRFAPSPTGYFHVGGARTALYNWILAVRQGGTFVLRIEDTDESRARPEFTSAILDDLAWLGLTWEQPVRRQSQHFADYAAALERLRQSVERLVQAVASGDASGFARLMQEGQRRTPQR